MSRQIRCDGCGGRLERAAMQGRHPGDMAGDEVPPPEFDWCRVCSRVAFEAVLHAAGRRRGQAAASVAFEPTEVLPGRTGMLARLPWRSDDRRPALTAADDSTLVQPELDRPPLGVQHARAGVGRVGEWGPNRFQDPTVLETTARRAARR